MGLQRLLIIPLMIILYIFFIGIIDQLTYEDGLQILTVAGGGAGENVGFGQSVSISVTRPYLFGLFRLPTYSAAFGYIGGWHDAYFTLVIIVSIALLLLEFKHMKAKNKPKRRR
jgi:hypothetical protein